MSSELLSVLEYMEKEKGIGRADMISAITNSIHNAAQKGVHAGQELKIEINPRTGSLEAWSLLNVTDSVGDPEKEIHVENARRIKSDAEIGEVIEKPIDPSYLGRIAAQTAKQAILQKIREFERERVFDDFKDQIGDIISGVVHRRDRSDLIVDLGKTEALLPRRERIPRENFNPGDRIRALLLKIETGNRGPSLILSRSSLRFVRRLLDLEVTEISDGTVVIERMSREPGYRTKICVNTTDPKVDPVGACVGARGSRVKSIVRELGGEKIDIIRYYPEIKEQLVEALSPAVPRNIQVDERNHRMSFEIAEDDLSVTIGKGGMNAKLTSQLLGWKLDIRREETKNVTIDQQVDSAAKGLVDSVGVQFETAVRLVNMGITSVAAFEGASAEDLVAMGISPEEAQTIISKVESE
ncbi:MAG: transcription termination factor NusA [Verrucomicrobiota bacterium]